jgi:hypothetical protein
MKKQINTSFFDKDLELPFWKTIPKPKSDALDDVQIRFNHLINFAGGVLATLSSLDTNQERENEVIQVNLKPKNEKAVISPKIKVKSEEWEKLFSYIPTQLFYSSIVQLATLYEVFLSELIKEILKFNDSWLEIEEKQITTKKIFSLGSLEKIKWKLIEKKILDFTMLSYPKKVEKFEKEFHVGLHHKSFPLTLFEVHDFLEVRNIIVHNDGHASTHYFDRLKSYNQDPLLKDKYSPEVNFSWLFTFGENLISLCCLVDKKISEKWTTTRNL